MVSGANLWLPQRPTLTFQPYQEGQIHFLNVVNGNLTPTQPAGGLTAGGVGAGLLGIHAYPAGGLTLTGTASSPLGVILRATGGMTIGGTPASQPGFAYLGTSGMDLGGVGFVSDVGLPTSYFVLGGGQIALSGTPPVSVDYLLRTSGGLQIGGTGTKQVGLSTVGSGLILLSGGAARELGMSMTGTGGLTFSGSGPKVLDLPYLPSGSALTINGTAWFVPVIVHYFTRGEGGLQISGTQAATSAGYIIRGSGGLDISGDGWAQFGSLYLPTGGLDLGGAGTKQIGMSATGAGGLTIGGTPAKRIAQFVFPVGGLAIGGVRQALYLDVYLRADGSLAFGGTAANRLGGLPIARAEIYDAVALLMRLWEDTDMVEGRHAKLQTLFDKVSTIDEED